MSRFFIEKTAIGPECIHLELIQVSHSALIPARPLELAGARQAVYYGAPFAEGMGSPEA